MVAHGENHDTQYILEGVSRSGMIETLRAERRRTKLELGLKSTNSTILNDPKFLWSKDEG